MSSKKKNPPYKAPLQEMLILNVSFKELAFNLAGPFPVQPWLGEDHLTHIQAVLETLRINGLTAKSQKKCV